ncbi:hypothetical protein PsYK624_077180 [Phanerochaete sordida]|uniref:Uncharacterized protein n=1 Tax=Phanerochaete sordida TaxID=48140 RepID=A0A9P3GAY9_9APHY|nr:hypothetical protein PsYK624_077180 [Phanerochaete sordida]
MYAQREHEHRQVPLTRFRGRARVLDRRDSGDRGTTRPCGLVVVPDTTLVSAVAYHNPWKHAWHMQLSGPLYTP